ncbi:MAG: hypothetical protein IJC43_05070 [Clostridia bacterium]|nr:hypothetical protein [Clostridia bacterium]
MPPRSKRLVRLTPMHRALILPVGCYLLGTLVGSLHYEFSPEAAGSMLLLLLLLFYGAFSLFGPVITVAACFAFGLLTGGISAGLLSDLTLTGLLCLLFLVFLLAPCLLLLAGFGLRSALGFAELLLLSGKDRGFSPLTGRLFLMSAVSLAAVLLYRLLVRLLL